MPLLHRHRALWDSPEAGYPKHRGAPSSWRLNTRSAPLARALPHRHSMRRTPPYAQAAAARNAQNGETSDVAPAPKMFAFMVLPGGLTAGTGNHNVKQQGPLGLKSSYALRPAECKLLSTAVSAFGRWPSNPGYECPGTSGLFGRTFLLAEGRCQASDPALHHRNGQEGAVPSRH